MPVGPKSLDDTTADQFQCVSIYPGATTVFLLFATTIFELVFTFNPSNSHTGGALGHSSMFKVARESIPLWRCLSSARLAALGTSSL